MKGDINPAQAQRKKDKERQLKKQKQERQNQRNERLAKRNPTRQLRQIAELEAKADLTSSEQDQLNSLKKDVEEIEAARKKLGLEELKKPRFTQQGNNKSQTNDPKKSYYWDPVLNPEGNPPEGEVPAYITDEEDSGYSTSESVSKIPLPERPPPSVAELKAGPAKSTYESAPVIRDLVKESATMVPVAVAKKKRTEPLKESPSVPTEPPMEEYASEEEEYHRSAKRRAVQLESQSDEDL
ncbi:hypothetical protein TRICI_006073 [Trichomonascus ciferrii]|uniref:Wbp11/ELF5/Saf1 N-terminal domain-containing protein n=1 Tax=Trichomonascus ciferrii TaxID=44093 RepID=A0A642UTE2_9ASCO|nr:hypothetical protein TRICI_006073 [Trichomonascus ciferrii]